MPVSRKVIRQSFHRPSVESARVGTRARADVFVVAEPPLSALEVLRDDVGAIAKAENELGVPPARVPAA